MGRRASPEFAGAALTVYHKAMDMYCLSVLEAGSLRSRGWWAHDHTGEKEPWEEDPSFASSSFWWPRRSGRQAASFRPRHLPSQGQLSSVMSVPCPLLTRTPVLSE